VKQLLVLTSLLAIASTAEAQEATVEGHCIGPSGHHYQTVSSEDCEQFGWTWTKAPVPSETPEQATVRKHFIKEQAARDRWVSDGSYVYCQREGRVQIDRGRCSVGWVPATRDEFIAYNTPVARRDRRALRRESNAQAEEAKQQAEEERRAITIVRVSRFTIEKVRMAQPVEGVGQVHAGTEVNATFEVSFAVGRRSNPTSPLWLEFDLTDGNGFSLATGSCYISFDDARFSRGNSMDVENGKKYRQKLFCYLGQDGDVNDAVAETLLVRLGPATVAVER